MHVCMSVTTLAATSVVSALKMRFILGFSRFLTRGFSVKPSVQKLWREYANKHVHVHVHVCTATAFKYRACMSRYLKAKD